MRFDTLEQLAKLCRKEDKPIYRLMLEEQSRESGRPAEREMKKMLGYYPIMKEAAAQGLTRDTTSRSGLRKRCQAGSGARTMPVSACLGR